MGIKFHDFYLLKYLVYLGEELHLNLENNYPHWMEDRLITNNFEFKRFKFKKDFSLEGFPDPKAREIIMNLNAKDESARKLYEQFQQCNPKGEFRQITNT